MLKMPHHPACFCVVCHMGQFAKHRVLEQQAHNLQESEPAFCWHHLLICVWRPYKAYVRFPAPVGNTVFS